MAFWAYSSGQKIKFTDSDVAAIYEIDMPDTKPGAYVDIIYHLETWAGPGKTNYVGADVSTVKGYIRGNSYTKVGNSWHRCVPFIKVQKNWKPCVCYQNVNKTWKRAHL